MKSYLQIIKYSAFPLLAILILSVFVSAQETVEKTEKAITDQTSDVSITGSVTAEELKFEIVPNPEVKFSGNPERNTEWTSERTNLPETVEPNVIYRDIGIRLKITSVFADIDRIVDEALGETPPPETKENGDGRTGSTTDVEKSTSETELKAGDKTKEKKPNQ